LVVQLAKLKVELTVGVKVALKVDLKEVQKAGRLVETMVLS
jgi:hypothetical protein